MLACGHGSTAISFLKRFAFRFRDGSQGTQQFSRELQRALENTGELRSDGFGPERDNQRIAIIASEAHWHSSECAAQDVANSRNGAHDLIGATEGRYQHEGSGIGIHEADRPGCTHSHERAVEGKLLEHEMLRVEASIYRKLAVWHLLLADSWCARTQQSRDAVQRENVPQQIVSLHRAVACLEVYVA